jgi:hypothetical protein
MGCVPGGLQPLQQKWEQLMIKLLQFLWSGCFHHWETIAVTELKYSGDFSSGTCDKYTLRCTKCGAMKVFENKWQENNWCPLQQSSAASLIPKLSHEMM